MTGRIIKAKRLTNAVQRGLGVKKGLPGNDDLCSMCKKQIRAERKNGMSRIASLRNPGSMQTIHIVSIGGAVCVNCLVRSLRPSVTEE